MKAIFIPLLVILCLTSVISCKSDDDATPEITNANLIVGTWNMTSNTVDNGSATVTVQGFPITSDFTWKGKDYDYQLTFDEDNTVAENGSLTLVLTYSTLIGTENQEIPLNTGANGNVLLSGAYSISSDQLTVTDDGETVTATIDELTETTLRLSVDIANVSPQLIDETVENVTGTNKITFIKQ